MHFYRSFTIGLGRVDKGVDCRACVGKGQEDDAWRACHVKHLNILHKDT